MQDQHLRPVPPVSNDDEAGAPAASSPSQENGAQQDSNRPQAAKSRPRPKKALPTDRMKLEVQKKALSVIAMLSDGKEAVGSADMAPRLGVVSTTAGLNNSFFFECGLIIKGGKGRYKSTEAANDFARRYSFDADRAGLVLKEPLSQTWFYRVVRQQIDGMGPTPKAQLIELLAYEAGTTNEYRVQLSSLLSWLEYAGLIELDDGNYKLGGDVPSDGGDRPANDEDGGAEEAKDKSAPEPTPARATKQEQPGGQGRPAETILGFSFDFALTGEQLAQLSPEQITALFRAVGEVMAIQATTTE